MEFLRRVHGVTLRDKVRSCEIRKALNVEPLLRIEFPAMVWPCDQNAPRKVDKTNSTGYTHGNQPTGRLRTN